MNRTSATIGFLLVASVACSGSRSRLTPTVTSGDDARSAAIDQIQIISEQLPSGYRVVSARTPPVAGRVPRIYIGSYVLHGSMQETRVGWAHLMEHVIANNRSTIAGPPRPEGINLIESNALTRPYYTSFVTVVQSSLLPSVLHSRMARAGRAENDSQVFRAQVGRVVAELERDMSGQYPAYKALVALARDHSPRLADELDIVRNTDRQNLAAAMSSIYRPHNAVLVVAGDLDLASTRALVHETETRLRLSEIRSPTPVSSTKPMLQTNRAAVVKDQNRSAHHVIGVGWPKPPLGHTDQLPLLIADQLLLGRGDAIDDPVRSDASPVAARLARTLGGSKFWDGRAGTWGAPDLVDTGPGIWAIIFNTDSTLTIDEVRLRVTAALREVRQEAMSDTEIERARQSLASFYERWFFEPTYRVLSDHLMAYASTGRDPAQVKNIPAQIRRVPAAAVRAAFDRYLLQVQPNVVILPASTPTRSN